MEISCYNIDKKRGNYWSSIDSAEIDNKIYYLMENNTWGDETCYLVIDENKNVICETFDDIETALADEGII